jgi:hypothetical protein
MRRTGADKGLHKGSCDKTKKHARVWATFKPQQFNELLTMRFGEVWFWVSASGSRQE